MVKFIELFDYIGMIHSEVECTCCKHKSPEAYIYKTEERMVVLCESCKTFLEEVLE